MRSTSATSGTATRTTGGGGWTGAFTSLPVIRTGSGSLAMRPPYVDPLYDHRRPALRIDSIKRSDMSNRVYRVTEVVGTSPDGIDQAIHNAIERASRTLRHLDWFEVTQVRGHLVDGRIEHYQVGLKVGFRLDDAD